LASQLGQTVRRGIEGGTPSRRFGPGTDPLKRSDESPLRWVHRCQTGKLTARSAVPVRSRLFILPVYGSAGSGRKSKIALELRCSRDASGKGRPLYSVSNSCTSSATHGALRKPRL